MKTIAPIVACLLLAACSSGDVRNTLGMDRAAPDEFKVVSRPPLSVPPEFNLRPPSPGEPPLAAPSTEKTAKEALFGEAPVSTMSLGDFKQADTAAPAVDTALDPVVEAPLESAAESNFLSKFGTKDVDPEIRAKLHKDEKDQPKTTADTSSPLEKWLGIADGEPVVDPKPEAERIRENKDKGKAVNEGDVKTVDPKKGSVLDKLF